MSRLLRKKKNINEKAQTAVKELEEGMIFESKIAAIQALIPLGLKAVEEVFQKEIADLAGSRYSRGGDIKRWGENPGSVYLGDQKVSVKVPRVRNTRSNNEVLLESYEQLQNPHLIDEIVLNRVIHGISQRDYEKAITHLPETFGIKKTSISRKFIRSSSKKLKEFMERDLGQYDIVAIFIDGKYFADRQIVIALGVTSEGKKILLGFIETSTENHCVCRQFLLRLKDRGLNLDHEILFVLDGGKGLNKGVKEVMGYKAIVQRCQWHKRENILSYLNKEDQAIFRKKLQSAYQEHTYEKVKQKLNALRKELQLININAVASLDEGLDETLTLHKLGLFKKLGESFKTTNCIENVNCQLGRLTDRVDRWQNSDQVQRWVGSSLLEIEKNLRTVKGYKFLKDLRTAMKKLTDIKNEKKPTIIKSAS